MTKSLMNAELAGALNLLPSDKPETRFSGLYEFMQNKLVITTCLILSVVLHGVFFIRWQGFETSHEPDMILGQNIEVILSQPTPVTDKVETIQHREKPTPVTPSQQKVITQQDSIDLIEKAIIEPEEIEPVAEQKITEKPVTEKQEVINQTQSSLSAMDNALLIDEKKKYLKAIAEHLDRHKYYPRSARRRHIEGEVKVSFDLIDNDEIINLHISSGHSSLQRATRESIYSSLPMPPRPEKLLALDILKIEYTMQYSLQD